MEKFNYSKSASETFSLFEISRKNLLKVANKLTPIDNQGMKKAKINDLKFVMQFLPNTAQNWYDENVFPFLNVNDENRRKNVIEESDSDEE